MVWRGNLYEFSKEKSIISVPLFIITISDPSVITYPSIVDSRGQHVSYKVHQASSTSQFSNIVGREDDTKEPATRTYFKVEAFGNRYLLNVSSSTRFMHALSQDKELPIVEYVRADSSSMTKTMTHSKPCYHSGHVHILREESPEEEREKELKEEVRGSIDGWVAVSSCSGLVST